MEKTIEKKNALFIVPHEDDELFVGEPLLIACANSKNYEPLVFISNKGGDYLPHISKKRILESLNVLKRIGVEDKSVFFGGYGDGREGKHI